MRQRSRAFGNDRTQRRRCILCERLMPPTDELEPDLICPQCGALGEEERRVLREQAMVRLLRRDLTTGPRSRPTLA